MFTSMKIVQYIESELFSIFLSETGRQKYIAWVSRDAMLSCFCSVMSLSEEAYTFSETDCYAIVFSLLRNILI